MVKSIMALVLEILVPEFFLCPAQKHGEKQREMTSSSRKRLKLHSKSPFWKILNENTTTRRPKVAKNSQPFLPTKKNTLFRQHKLYVLV